MSTPSLEPAALGTAIHLRPHQVETLEAALKHLARFDRAHDVLACGTGKTVIGRAVADALASHGRTLVVVPRILLIPQAISDYRRLGGDTGLGRVVIACSDSSLAADPRLAGLGAVVTTDPAELAQAASGPGRTTVIATYDSACTTVAAAHARHGLPPWDLLQADEAHHMVGTGTWTRVHDDAVLPAAKRRYTTATPRVLTGKAASDDSAVSMADPDVFGVRSYTLGFAEAIDRGLLCGWRVVAAVVTDAHVHGLGEQALSISEGGAAVTADVLAGQIAVLKAMAEFGGRRLLSFHPRVADAKAWAATLPQAARLVSDHGGLTVAARHLNGGHSGAVRRRVLDWFSHPDERGIRAITNVRLFHEGFDAPACDTIALTHRNGSIIDLIQTLSRALRTDPQRPDKTATFIVPVRLRSEQDLDEALADPQWDTLRQALRALGSMDTTIYDQAARTLRAHGAQTDAAARAPDATPAAASAPDWLHVRGVPVPPGFAASVGLAVSRVLAPPVEVYLGAAAAYARTHGHLAVPRDHVTGTGLDLGRWLHRWRERYRNGVRGTVVDALNAMGMVWNQTAWKMERGRREADAFYRAFGHMRVPTDHVTETGYPLGLHITNRRQARRRGLMPQEEIAWWDAYGMIWNVVEAEEARYRKALDDFYSAHGHINVPADYTAEGLGVGQMLSTRRAAHAQGRLSAEAVAFHEQRNVDWDGRSAAHRKQADRKWEHAYHFAAVFHQAHGHLKPAKGERVTDPATGATFGLWDWVARNHRRWYSLPADKQKRLLDIGFQPPDTDAIHAAYRQCRSIGATALQLGYSPDLVRSCLRSAGIAADEDAPPGEGGRAAPATPQERAAAVAAALRDGATNAQIEQRYGLGPVAVANTLKHHGHPTRWRLRSAAIADRLRAGDPEEAVAADFPDVSRVRFQQARNRVRAEATQLQQHNMDARSPAALRLHAQPPSETFEQVQEPLWT
ncbi:Helicase associated domain protein [Streptomonospora nanhaiensis]|uniref:DEAD/DEAH box helicase n=1 Tax=Streptomonospora nanhaiensis TaxID=1323731 RepID=UPI001C99830C|nr:DEAD/DEAH box helicase [Streptomonospora nanhaiensis]MBX9389467.1 Helicase associated domain protein [Streptomonospora nanhaiensis]